MIRQPCEHNVVLPKSLRCNHGYLEMLLQVNGRSVCKTFGQHTKDSQKVAEIYLAEKRKEIMLGTFKIGVKLKSKTFEEVSKIWFDIWSKEVNPDGTQAHSEESVKQTAIKLYVLNRHFGKFVYNSIRPLDIQEYWTARVKEGIKGTTLNRYTNLLSSVFTSIDNWIKLQKIKAFKCPESNPCSPIERAETVKRTRILTHYEASKLRLAFETLNDADGWEICKLAIKSVLSTKDLRRLEVGQEIDTERAKTGVPINLPIQYLVKLNWVNWAARWKAARKTAGLIDLQFRDLRKTGINWLKGRHDLKLVSEYAGHADIKTTEKSYTIKQAEYLEPLAKDLEEQVNKL